MFTKTKKLIKDILYVSKLTGVNNKKRTVAIAVLLSQVSAATDIAIILLFTSFITDNIPESFLFITDLVKSFPLFLPVIVILRYVFYYLQAMLLKNLELNVLKNIRVHLLKEVFDKRNYSVSDAYFYLNVLSSDIAFFYSNLASFLNSILQIIAYLTYLVVTDSRTLFTFFIGVLVLFYPSKVLISKSREAMHQFFNFSEKVNEEIQRIVENIFLIKLLKKDEDEINNFTNTLKDLNKSEHSKFKYGVLNSQLPGFITLFTFSCILLFGNIIKMITLDFIGVTLRLLQSFGQSTGSFNRLINSSVSIERFYDLEDNKNLVNKDNYQHNKTIKSEIEFSNVNFRYFNSETDLFNDLSFKVKSNSHTILTGPNGSGKSTILGLMSGVLYPQKGIVSTKSKNFGYIGATPLIFSAPIKDNVLYGNDKDISDIEIINELKRFDTFKEEESYKLDRVITNTTLSSGQMQKIAFVRALLSDIDILLLDESTANLDDKSRKLIFNILSERNITIINSTHDAEKFKNVDQSYDIIIEDEKRLIVPK